jgi:hypothetical protein
MMLPNATKLAVWGVFLAPFLSRSGAALMIAAVSDEISNVSLLPRLFVY